MAMLLEWLWQGLALTAGVAALLRAVRPLGAATRYALWWATLAVVLALPFVPALAGFGTAPEGAADPVAAAPLVEPWVPVVLPEPADWLMAAAVGVWLGVLLLSLRSIWRAATHLSRLRRGASPVPEAREACLPLWLSVRDTGRHVRLAQSRDVAAPAALGLGPAMVVLPRALVWQLSDEELDQIALHEYGHLRRRDDWARLAQAIVRAVAWFHPAVWWIDRQLELEREAACDDFVVRRTGAAHGYAACLARAAELAGPAAHAGTLAPGMTASRGQLLARVGRLLDGRPRRPRLGVALAAVAAGLVALPSGVRVLSSSRPLVAVSASAAIARPAVSGPRAGDPLAARPIAPIAPPAVLPAFVPARSTPPPAAATWAPAAPDLAVAQDTLRVPGAPVPPPAWIEPRAHVLDGTPLAVALAPGEFARSAASTRPGAPLGAPGERGPWSQVADAGVNVGMGVKKAGVATAGFFGRLGRSIAGAF